MLTRGFVMSLLTVSISAGVAAAPNPAPRQGTANANEVVCEKVEITGSRLAVKRVCMTRAEWADRRQQDRSATEKAQILGAVPQN